MAFNGNINERKKLISDVIDYKMLKDLQQKGSDWSKVFETVENQLTLVKGTKAKFSKLYEAMHITTLLQYYW